MSDSGTDQVRELRCPRCGYDLSGLPSSWKTSCPVFGVCSECGLDIIWGDVLNPRLTMPKWLFEDEFLRGRRMVRAYLRTMSRTRNPFRFWRDVRLVHAVSPRRLVWATIWSALVIYLCGALSVYLRTVVAVNWWTGGVVMDWSLDGVTQAARRAVIWPRLILTPDRIAPLMYCLLIPLSFVVLSDSRRLGRIRWAHIWRVAVYGVGALISWTLFVLIIDLTLYGLHIWAVVEGQGRTFQLLDYREPLHRVWLAGCALWMPLWWGVATARYMRLHMWWAVTASVISLAGLATFVAMSLWALRPW